MIRRQSIKTAVIVSAMVIPMGASARQQQSPPQTTGMAQPSVEAAVTGCAQAHPMVERTIDMTNRRLEAARQANSPAAMRAAIDDMQAALRQLRAEIAPCAALQWLAPASNPHPGHMVTTAANPATTGETLMCQTKVDPNTAPRAMYQGRTYYFCTEKDRAEFAKEPAKYIKAPVR